MSKVRGNDSRQVMMSHAAIIVTLGSEPMVKGALTRQQAALQQAELKQAQVAEQRKFQVNQPVTAKTHHKQDCAPSHNMMRKKG